MNPAAAFAVQQTLDRIKYKDWEFVASPGRFPDSDVLITITAFHDDADAAFFGNPYPDIISTTTTIAISTVVLDTAKGDYLINMIRHAVVGLEMHEHQEWWTVDGERPLHPHKNGGSNVPVPNV